MRPLDFFERKFLFILARAFFLLLVLVAVAASCIGADQFWKDYQQTVKPVTVAPSEVFADPAKATPAVSASAPDGASISAGGDVEAGLHLGFWTTKAISDRDTKKVGSRICQSAIGNPSWTDLRRWVSRRCSVSPQARQRTRKARHTPTR
jgi:hypothetical protein